MPRGQYQRKATVAAPDAPVRPYAVLVEALPKPEPEEAQEPALTLSEMLAAAIRAETTACEYEAAAAVGKVAICLGELRRALAVTHCRGDLGDALGRLAELI